MKKIMIAFLCVITITQAINAITHTNKTFMATPTPHYYLPMKYSSWHRILKQGSSAEDPWGVTIQAAPFYHSSSNAPGLGKYFGTNYKNVLKVGGAGPDIDIRSDLLVHKNDPTEKTKLKGSIKLEPKRTEYGLYFSYHQELNAIHRGLFLEVNLPFMHVETDPNITVTDDAQDSAGSLREFFLGALKQTSDADIAAGNKQDPLCFAKIGCLQSKTGIGDIELLFGGKLADKAEHEVNGAIKVIVPTGSKPTGEYLFAPTIGNGKHWEVGAHVYGSMNILKNDIHSLECLFHAEYTYIFSANEKRTLGYRQPPQTTIVTQKCVDEEDTDKLEDLRYTTSASTPWNYYYLGGESGKQGVFPLANVLTQDVSVVPGSKLQGHLSFAYHRNNTTVDFGYSFFSQEGEKIKLSGSSCQCWTDNKYAVAHPNYSTTSSFDTKPYLAELGTGEALGGPITRDLLDVTTPATPAALKHSVHMAISHTLSEWENPFMMGLGFSVDWTHDNATPTGYTIWGKFGGTF